MIFVNQFAVAQVKWESGKKYTVNGCSIDLKPFSNLTIGNSSYDFISASYVFLDADNIQYIGECPNGEINGKFKLSILAVTKSQYFASEKIVGTWEGNALNGSPIGKILHTNKTNKRELSYATIYYSLDKQKHLDETAFRKHIVQTNNIDQIQYLYDDLEAGKREIARINKEIIDDRIRTEEAERKIAEEEAKRRAYENSPAYKAEVKRREAQERAEDQRRQAYANSPAGRAEEMQRQQRYQGRQMCEAQKQTCFASCPPRAEGFRLNSTAHEVCRFQCDRINCN